MFTQHDRSANSIFIVITSIGFSHIKRCFVLVFFWCFFFVYHNYYFIKWSCKSKKILWLFCFFFLELLNKYMHTFIPYWAGSVNFDIIHGALQICKQTPAPRHQRAWSFEHYTPFFSSIDFCSLWCVKECMCLLPFSFNFIQEFKSAFLL